MRCAVPGVGAPAEETEAECSICQEGREAGPLEDACGHGHMLHPGCASLWRAHCMRMRAAAERYVMHDPREPDGYGPHCPTCRRPI